MYFIYLIHVLTYQIFRANISRVVETQKLTLKIKPKTKIMMIISPSPPAPTATTTQPPPLPPIQQNTAINFSKQMHYKFCAMRQSVSFYTGRRII